MSLSSNASSSNERRPPKKRDLSYFDADSSDEEYELLYGSPALRPAKLLSTKPSASPTLNSASPEKNVEGEAPKRRSPRRSSIATLDAASSPSTDVISQASTIGSNQSPSEPIVLMDDDDDNDYSIPRKKKSKKDRKKNLHDDDNILVSMGRDPDASSSNTSFALTKPPSSKQCPSKNNAMDSKPKKKTEKGTTSTPTTTVTANDSMQKTKELPPARVSLSAKKKPKKREHPTDPADEPASSNMNKKAPAPEQPLPEDITSVKPPSKKTKKKSASQTTSSATGTDIVPELPEQKYSNTDSANASLQESQAVKKTTQTSETQEAMLPEAGSDTMRKKAKTLVASPTKTVSAPQTVPSSASTTASGKVKKKKKKLNFQDSVFQHMFLTMKPFTLKSLAAELQTTDTALNYVMLSLVDKGLVVKKDFTSSKGKTKTLYWAVDGVQSKEVSATCASSAAERKEATQQLQCVQSELSTLRKTLSDIQSDLSNEEIEKRLQQEEAKRNDLQQKVDAIRNRMKNPAPPKPKPGLLGRKAPPKAPATQKQLKHRINNMRGEWKERKRKCVDFCDQLADAMEKKPKEVFKLLDLETDEMCKVTLPAKYDMEPDAKKKR